MFLEKSLTEIGCVLRVNPVTTTTFKYLYTNHDISKFTENLKEVQEYNVQGGFGDNYKANFIKSDSGSVFL